jgi:hypothetical protein
MNPVLLFSFRINEHSRKCGVKHEADNSATEENIKTKTKTPRP